MEISNMLMIIIIICLLLISGFISATDASYKNLNRSKIRSLAMNGNKRAEKVNGLLDRQPELDWTMLICNTTVNIFVTLAAYIFFTGMLGRGGLAVAVVVIVLIILVFAEISPNALSGRAPERFAMFSQPFASAMVTLLKPINFIFKGWKKLLYKIFKIDGEKGVTDEDLKNIVEEAETEGILEADRSELIQNAIEFNELTAEEVMTPRVDIKALDIDSTMEEVADVFRETGFSRLPVYDEDLDSILGVLNQKDFHNYIVGTGRTISDFVKPVVFVATSIRIADLLKRLQAMKTHIAIIVDEYGGTEGLVTMEDIIEELVGEIYDEHDVVMSREVTELQNGSYRVMCNANLDKVFDFFGIEEELEEVNTVNGWVVIALDRLPKKGDVFSYESGNKVLNCKVTKATPRKALEINVKVESREIYGEEGDETEKTAKSDEKDK